MLGEVVPLAGGPPEATDEPGPVWLYVGTGTSLGGGPDCPPGGGGSDEAGTVTLDVTVTVGVELKSLTVEGGPDGGGKTL